VHHGKQTRSLLDRTDSIRRTKQSRIARAEHGCQGPGWLPGCPRKGTKRALGFGCSASHSRNGKRRVGVPGRACRRRRAEEDLARYRWTPGHLDTGSSRPPSRRYEREGGRSHALGKDSRRGQCCLELGSRARRVAVAAAAVESEMYC
jgi:hypothetical protein